MGKDDSIDSSYKQAYERERKARQQAEEILEAKSRHLYTVVQQLKETNEQLHRQKENLVQTEKMAAIGQLSAGIAHEINNPLAFIISNFNTLQKYYRSFVDVSNLLAHAEEGDLFAVSEILKNNDFKFISMDTDVIFSETNEGLLRIQDIIKNLRNFTHSKPGARGSVAVNDSVLSALSIVKNQIKYHCEVKTDFSNVPLIYANENELIQVLINILINASQAILKQGVIQVNTFEKENFVYIEVVDDGIGISEENLMRIFDPFYTSKPVGEGTGLGLSVSYGIIKEFGGDIVAESSPGKGTRMCIRLPIEQRIRER